MSLPTSPLTLKPAEEKVPNSIYLEDSSELWFDPECLRQHANECTARPATPAELQADKQLATALHSRYVKKDEGRMLDMYAETASLTERFNELGYGTYASGMEWKAGTKFNLITYVHTFQKVPARVAREELVRAADQLEPGGYIFIRLPDHSVDGYERDLNPSLMGATPCFWNLNSFLELLAQVEKLKIVETYELKPGQRDIFLQRLERKPRICAGMIVKNEERDLPTCLESIKDVVDGVVVIDTGSTDQTMKIAQDWIKDRQLCKTQKPLFKGRVEQYLGASEQDDSGDWKLWDFGKARNVFVQKIEELGDFDYCLWMDADDKLLTPREMANLVYLEPPVIHGIRMLSGDIIWTHHRLWKTKKGIRFHGRCHEYPAWAGNDHNHKNVMIFHDAAPGAGENANIRNRRILEREVEEAPTPRNCFYLANTHKDGNRWAEALKYYEKRMEYGKGYEEEYWFAALYKSRCLRSLRRYAEAEKFIFECLKERSDWSEFWMELAYLEYDRNDATRSLGYCLSAADRPLPPSNLFREPNKYHDQPYRYASFAAERMGNTEMALSLALKAKEKIGGPDVSWDQRIETLRGGKVAPVINKSVPIVKKTKKVCWHRPGAIGDVLMTLNLVKPFRKQNPDCEIVYKTHPTTSQHLHDIILEAGVDRVISTEDTEKFDEFYNLVGYPLAEGYPNKPMSDHLVRYFAKELGIQKLEDTDLLYNLVLTPPSRLFLDKYCTIHTQAGWSPYKNWQMDRWQQIAERLMDAGIAVVQIGGPGDARIKGAEHLMLGKSFKQNLETMAYAEFHLGIDSWSNHATNIIWKLRNDRCKGVILWGSTQAAAAGYKTNRNISIGLPCQPCFREDPKLSQMSRGVCPNPAGQVFENPQHACMAGISVDRVWEEVKGFLNNK